VSGIRFLPWVRNGMVGSIQGPADVEGALPARAQVKARLVLRSEDNAETVVEKTVRLHGPGDVIGVDAAQIARCFPSAGADNAETTRFAEVEFSAPDLPWAFTPGAPDAQGRLRPWLVLVVVPEEKAVLERGPGAGTLVLTCPREELPDLKESWAWAHAQVPGEDLGALLANSPSRALSRLLCPRRLKPRARYIAAVVPAFKAGVRAGLGLAPEPGELSEAWSEADSEAVKLPVYHHWRFSTGEGGDFESLVRRLRPHPIGHKVGLRPMDIRHPGSGLPELEEGAPGSVLGFEGALRGSRTQPTAWVPAVRQAWATRLRQLLKGSGKYLTPPLYGGAQAGLTQLPAKGEPPDWLQELNLDPRYRAAAALGTRAVQAHQEELVAAAWEQAARFREANQLLLQAQFARSAGAAFFDRRFVPREPGQTFTSEQLVALARPVHDLVPGEPSGTRSLAQALSGNPGAGAATSASFRRLARPRGPLMRRRSSSTAASPVLGRLAEGSLRIVPRLQLPGGMLTLDQVASSMGSGVSASELSATLFSKVPRWWSQAFVEPPKPLPVPPAGPAVASSPSMAVETFGMDVTRMFLVMSGGRLFEYCLTGTGWEWRDHGDPPGTQVVHEVNAVLGNGSAFVSAANGHVLQRAWDGDRWVWRDHGRPRGLPGTPETDVASGTALIGNSVFVAGQNGHLFELRPMGEGWEWMDRGRPGSSGLFSSWKVIGMPGAAISGSRFFVRVRPAIHESGNEALAECRLNADGTVTWTVHGQPRSLSGGLTGLGSTPGPLSPDASAVYGVTAEGQLVRFSLGVSMLPWKSLGAPPKEPLAPDGGPALLITSGLQQSLFVARRDGPMFSLERFLLDIRSWKDHGQPEELRVKGHPGGLMTRTVDGEVVRTFFVRTENGRLASLSAAGEGAWQWELHPEPRVPEPGGKGGAGDEPEGGVRWAPRLGMFSSLVAAHLENPMGANRVLCRVGRDAGAEAEVRAGWDTAFPVGPVLGQVSSGLGFAVAHISSNEWLDMVVLDIEPWAMGSRATYRVGRRLDASGQAQEWSAEMPLPELLNPKVQAAALCIANLDGGERPQLILAYVTGGPGAHRVFYRIGWGLDPRGQVTRGWSESREVPWTPGTVHGVGIDIVDLDNDDKPDVVILLAEERAGADQFIYRIGRRINARGHVVGGWGPELSMGGAPVGARHQGVGIAVVDFTGSYLPDLLVFRLQEDPGGGGPSGFYRVGFDLDAQGVARTWSPDQQVPGSFGPACQGAAIAVADLDPVLVKRRTGVWESFKQAGDLLLKNYLEVAQKLSQPEGSPPPISVGHAASSLLQSLDPRATVPARVLERVKIAGKPLPIQPPASPALPEWRDPLRPLLGAISFPQPAYELLRELSEDFLLPQVERVPPDSVSLLRSNARFIEAFLVGLNTEMGRELLWRGFPADARATYFQRFWDVRNSASGAASRTDIPPISRWAGGPLGSHVELGESGQETLIVLFRGELLRRYPSTIISFGIADSTLEPYVGTRYVLRAGETLPSFSGWMGPDIFFMGFPLPPEPSPYDRPEEIPSTSMLILREQPTALRFGVDEPPEDGEPVTMPERWEDLHWGHLVQGSADAGAVHVRVKDTSVSTLTLGGITYGLNSAHMARIVLQPPVKVAVPSYLLMPRLYDSRQVTAVRRLGTGSKAGRLQALAGRYVDRAPWELSVEQVMDEVELGEFFYVQEGKDGPKAPLQVIRRKDGTRYLRSAPIPGAPNLQSLPEIPQP
jgi:hypothetical protein